MGLQLSTRGRYGMRALCRLAQNYGGAPISIQSLSDEDGIPMRYLEQIMGRLRREGLVNSIRGPKGGYWLDIPPAEIKLGHALRTLEGSISLVWCVDEKEDCPHKGSCPTAHFWCAMNDGIQAFLDATSLAQLVDGGWADRRVRFLVEPKGA